MMEMGNRIKIEDCKHGWVYRLYSRNLKVGMFDANTKAFVGVRTKFGQKFLDREYHWDTGAPHGTCSPTEELLAFPFVKALQSSVFTVMEELDQEYAHPKESRGE